MIIKLDKLSPSAYAGLVTFLTSERNLINQKDIEGIQVFSEVHHEKSIRRTDRDKPGFADRGNTALAVSFLKEAKENRDDGSFSVVLEVIETIHTGNGPNFSTHLTYLKELMNSANLFPDKEKPVRSE